MVIYCRKELRETVKAMQEVWLHKMNLFRKLDCKLSSYVPLVLLLFFFFSPLSYHPLLPTMDNSIVSCWIQNEELAFINFLSVSLYYFCPVNYTDLSELFSASPVFILKQHFPLLVLIKIPLIFFSSIFCADVEIFFPMLLVRKQKFQWISYHCK